MGADGSKPEDANREATQEAAPIAELVDTVTSQEQLSWMSATDRSLAPRETVGVSIPESEGSHRVCVIAGRGEAMAEYQDVHTLDGGVWKEQQVDGVGIVVFGGLSAERGYLSDTALLKQAADGGFEWEAVCVSGELPCARDKHSAVSMLAASVGDDTKLGPLPSMIVFGGFGILPPDDEDEESEDEEQADDIEAGPTKPAPSLKMGWFDDIYTLALPSFRWKRMPIDKQASRPAARAAHAACWLEGVDSMLIFGGRTAVGRSNDTWLLSATGCWTQPKLVGQPPRAKSFHSVVRLVSPAGSELAAVFGGLDSADRHLNELHLLHVEQMAWCHVKALSPPTPRGCAAVACVGGSAIVVFGGTAKWDANSGASSFLQDTTALELRPLLTALDSSDTASEAAALEAGAPAEAPPTSFTDQKRRREDGELPEKKARLADENACIQRSEEAGVL